MGKFIEKRIGGELELSKCFFYLILWSWDKQGNPVPENRMSQNDQLIVNKIKIGNGIENLKQKEVHKSHKTLGTYKCLFGDKIEHILYLKEKVIKWISR
jgi:hypothetical protein